jgi:hypothetical protein
MLQRPRRRPALGHSAIEEGAGVNNQPCRCCRQVLLSCRATVYCNQHAAAGPARRLAVQRASVWGWRSFQSFYDSAPRPAHRAVGLAPGTSTGPHTVPPSVRRFCTALHTGSGQWAVGSGQTRKRIATKALYMILSFGPSSIHNLTIPPCIRIPKLTRTARVAKSPRTYCPRFPQMRDRILLPVS